ncbi:MAG: hypothetical protein OXF56_09395 [Rhodobacteraceae bacterium]|nr:hypothetical protein [Paracoccaceae bacterium]
MAVIRTIARERRCAVEVGREPSRHLHHRLPGNPDTRVEVARYLAGRAKTEPTRLYGRRAETILLDEIRWIGI